MSAEERENTAGGEVGRSERGKYEVVKKRWKEDGRKKTVSKGEEGDEKEEPRERQSM